MLRRLMAGAAAVVALVPAAAVAQTEGSATLYSRGNFTGSRYTLSGPVQGIEFKARSVQVEPGTAWEFCTGNKFSGCRQVNQSDRGTVMTVRSARPVRPVIATAAAAAAGTPLPSQSLRGLASEFFVSPQDGGGLIEVQEATGAAASSRAADFCRTRGWRSSAHERMQTVGGRTVLADVLCTDEGR